MDAILLKPIMGPAGRFYKVCAILLAIVAWIDHFIGTSRKLGDAPSASIAISIVAIPVFLTLLGVFWYVFIGVLFNQREGANEGVED